MSVFFKKQQIGAMASVVTSLILVSGCRSASVNSTVDGNRTPGVIGLPPVYRSSPETVQPYDGGMNQAPTPQPSPPSVLPVPGYTEPEIPPPPSANKSRWNFRPTNFKFPSKKSQTADVHQTGAKTDERARLSKFGKNKIATPTLRDDEDDVTEEVVRPRASTVTSREVRSSETPIVESDRAPSSDSLPTLSSQPLKTPIRTRYGVINQWPSSKNGSRSTRDTNGSSDANIDVPLLSPPASVDEVPAQHFDVPRLLPPNG